MFFNLLLFSLLQFLPSASSKVCLNSPACAENIFVGSNRSQTEQRDCIAQILAGRCCSAARYHQDEIVIHFIKQGRLIEIKNVIFK